MDKSYFSHTNFFFLNKKINKIGKPTYFKVLDQRIYMSMYKEILNCEIV